VDNLLCSRTVPFKKRGKELEAELLNDLRGWILKARSETEYYLFADYVSGKFGKILSKGIGWVCLTLRDPMTLER